MNPNGVAAATGFASVLGQFSWLLLSFFLLLHDFLPLSFIIEPGRNKHSFAFVTGELKILINREMVLDLAAS